MTTIEILTIVGGLALGYLVVSMLFGRKAPAAKVNPLAPHWSQVLNVRPDAGPEEIRQAHQAAAALYDPAQVAQMGTELRAVAEEKSAQIDSAYHQALAERGHTP